jgi:hypothetical protein
MTTVDHLQPGLYSTQGLEVWDVRPPPEREKCSVSSLTDISVIGALKL